MPSWPPDECAHFETEFRAALGRAETDLDLAPVERLLDRWWGIATIRANPLSDVERDQVARARAGDETGWIVHDKDGVRTRLQRFLMPGFTARWLELADEYYAALPPQVQRQVDERVARLLQDPYGPEDAYDPVTDQWMPPTATASA